MPLVCNDNNDVSQKYKTCAVCFHACGAHETRREETPRKWKCWVDKWTIQTLKVWNIHSFWLNFTSMTCRFGALFPLTTSSYFWIGCRARQMLCISALASFRVMLRAVLYFSVDNVSMHRFMWCVFEVKVTDRLAQTTIDRRTIGRHRRKNQLGSTWNPCRIFPSNLHFYWNSFGGDGTR